MHISAKYWRTSVALVAVVVALVVPATRASASNQNPGVLPPQSRPFGLTYGEWSARWWQWALSISVHNPPFSTNVNHPLVGQDGTRCGVGQSGEVWFLGGALFQNGVQTTTTIVRDGCTVPPGKALFFPPLNAECSFLEGPANGCPGTTVDELRADIAPFMDQATSLLADVDGVAITVGSPTGPFRVKSPPFGFTLPPDNFFPFIGDTGTFNPGTYPPMVGAPMVGDGFYLMLAPLSAGRHTVHFFGQTDGFMLDVTYHLTVG